MRVSRASGGGADAVRHAAFSLARRERGRVRVTWDDTRHPMVMVRDPATGRCSALGAAEVRTDAAEVELLCSDGVRTTGRWVRVPRGG